MNAGIVSLHWDNIDARIPHYQQLVFEHLNIPLTQHKIDRLDHGEWMDWVLERSQDLDVVVFFDVDCIPVDATKTHEHIKLAKWGHLVGNMQAANHIDPRKTYAGPSFMCVNLQMWRALGKPSSKAYWGGDVGQMLTDTWRHHGKPVFLLPPTHVEEPRWDLPEQPNAFGIGTTFGEANYHLFECRTDKNIDRFVERANSVLDW